MAATQQLPYGIADQSMQQTLGAPQDDQQELFLRSLFATPVHVSPSGASSDHQSHTTTPTAVHSESISGSSSSGLSPVSSASFQNIQDFMFASPPVKMEQIKDMSDMHASMPSAAIPFASAPSNSFDQRALEYFFNSMNGFDGNNGMPAFNNSMHFAGQPHSMPMPMIDNLVGQNPGMLSQSMPQNTFSFAPPGNMNVPSFSNHGPQIEPQMQIIGDSRKRSVGTLPPPFQATGPDAIEPMHKRMRSGPEQPMPIASMQSWGAAIPHMEVGSNATALAAIERLKAQKRAAAARQEQQARAGQASSVKVEHGVSSSSAPRQSKKVAHNAIERRYRNNINARIAALRNAVPALRELRPKRPTRKGKEVIPEDLVDGVPAATKLNKATILGKSTEYIRYLKSRELRLASEVAGLRELIRSLEGGEELLDLWQDEMERVVAAQQREQEQQQFDEDGGDYDDEDGEDDEDDSGELRSSPSSSSGPARYMMGIAMGFTVLGSTSSDAHFAATANHPAGRVIGASRQLLKRGMNASNVRFSDVADAAHHLDHTPSHHLLMELVRAAIIVSCVAFLFWPIIARLLPFQRKAGKDKMASVRAIDSSKLSALKRTSTAPTEEDYALRQVLGAPTNAVSSSLGLASLTAAEACYRLRIIQRPLVNQSELAGWSQLLELETSLSPLAQRSLLARLHTLAHVATLRTTAMDQSDAPVSSSRLYGTMALAVLRSTSGSMLAMPIAERFWTMARHARLVAPDADEMSASRSWVDAVLALPLSQAASLCPSPTMANTDYAMPCTLATRMRVSAPLISVAAGQSAQKLADLWAEVLCHVTKGTAGDKVTTPLQAFGKHIDARTMSLACISNASDRESLSKRIAQLAKATPPCANLHVMTNVLVGTWALLLGNVAISRSVALALMTDGAGRASAARLARQPACASAFVSLVLSDTAADAAETDFDDSFAEVDALASSTLSWLSFTRRFAQSAMTVPDVTTASLKIRRQLAVARSARVSSLDTSLAEALSGAPTASALLPRSSIASIESSVTWTPSEDAEPTSHRLARNLDEAIDALTDVLAVLGRRAALRDPKTTPNVASLLKAAPDADELDSGVECA